MYRLGRTVVLGDHAAQRDSGMGIHAAQQHVEKRAAHIFKQTVNALRCCRLEVLPEVFCLVIEASIKAQLLNDMTTLGGPPRETDDTTALQLGQLPDHAAHRPRRRRHHHRFTCFRLANIHQPHPGRHARHAKHTQIRLERKTARIHLLQAIPPAEREFLPAQPPNDGIPHMEPGMIRGDDDSRRTAEHDFVQRLRRCVRTRFIHAPAHVRIER